MPDASARGTWGARVSVFDLRTFGLHTDPTDEARGIMFLPL